MIKRGVLSRTRNPTSRFTPYRNIQQYNEEGAYNVMMHQERGKGVTSTKQKN